MDCDACFAYFADRTDSILLDEKQSFEVEELIWRPKEKSFELWGATSTYHELEDLNSICDLFVKGFDFRVHHWPDEYGTLVHLPLSPP